MTASSTLSDVQALRDERAHLLDQVDDICRTAQQAERQLTREERRELDQLSAQAELLERLVDRGIESAQRSVSPNRVGAYHGVAPERSLDAMFWATSESVAAGVIARSGRTFAPDPHGAQNFVPQVVLDYREGAAPVLAPRITEFAPDHQQAVRAFQKLTTDMVVFGALTDPREVKSAGEAFQVARGHKMYADRWNHALRAMDVDTSAEGTEWVPTGIGAQVHEKVRAMGKVAPLFETIDLPTNPWRWPVEGSDAVAYRVGEPTSDTEAKMTASTPGTVAPTFDAEIFGARTLVSRSLDSDSAALIVPYIGNKIARAHAIAVERALLDGDSDGTHQDSDVGASTTDARSAWDGLRKKALAQTTVTATSTSVANLGLLRKGMGVWGVDPGDLAFIIGVSSMHNLMADSNLLTVDKFGPNATVLAGQIGSVLGVPVIVSEYVRENLNASGVYDGITTTKTYQLCVNRSAWAIGQRMALNIEVDDSVYRETYQRLVIGFQRLDVQNLCTAATDDDTAISFNVTP